MAAALLGSAPTSAFASGSYAVDEQLRRSGSGDGVKVVCESRFGGTTVYWGDSVEQKNGRLYVIKRRTVLGEEVVTRNRLQQKDCKFFGENIDGESAGALGGISNGR